ncbi:MAG: acyltransferase family protein [Ghiorsea sp.]|nr:acyltransferase family protein [Ghiorsea sp.]
MLFWWEADYFDASAITKPLLHTWSLAVEEQFYIFYPLLLFVAFRFLHRGWKYMIAIVVIISLALSSYIVLEHPSMAFYWAPLRAWELLMGAVLALGMVPMIRSQKLREIIAMTGLFLILFAYFYYTGKNIFPGLSALLPCLGAAMIIHAGTAGHTKVGTLLSLKPVVFIGLISYSLYLWHWPLIVLLKSYLVFEPNIWQMSIALLLSFGLAVFSWKYIEQPFRNKILFTRKRIFIGSLGAMTLSIILGLWVYKTDGLPQRIPADVLNVANYTKSMNPNRPQCFGTKEAPASYEAQCVIGGGNVEDATTYLMGDSHADSLYGAFFDLNEKYGLHTLYAADAGCPPLDGLGTTKQCLKTNADKIKYILEHKNIQNVVLMARWSTYANWSAYLYSRKKPIDMAGQHQNLSIHHNKPDDQYEKFFLTENKEAFATALKRTVHRLVQAGKNIILVYPVPEPDYNVPQLLAKHIWHNKNYGYQTTKAFYDQHNKLVISILDTLIDSPKVTPIYPADILCHQGLCSVSGLDGLPLYRDDNHLSLEGSRFISSLFVTPLSLSHPSKD